MRIVAALLALLLILLVWGVVVEPRLIDEEKWSVRVARLPASWEGVRVAVIADLQVGMWLDNTKTIRQIVERVIADSPAMVLIAGDFIYHPLGERGGASQRNAFSDEAKARAAHLIERAVSLVRPLVDADIPTYAVLGNHDYGMQTRQAARLVWLARDLQQALESAGIRVLQNEAVAVPAPPDRGSEGQASLLYLVGVGSLYANNDDVEKALGQVPAGGVSLVMMHNPGSAAKLPAGTTLAFAGHTHGGQIRIPFTPEWSWMSLVYPGEIHADGWIEGTQGGGRLYVNRGIGFSVIPVRINATPEISWIELHRHD